MKRSVFLIIGVLLVFILLAIWIYVLFFSTPDDRPQFPDFDFGNTTDPSADQPVPEPAEEPTVDVAGPEQLRQLTTRPVIGFQEVLDTTTGRPLVYYVEAGVGHVYQINLATGEEERISGTTFPTAMKAAISPNGQHVMMQSGVGNTAEFSVGTFSTSTGDLLRQRVDENIMDFTASASNTFLYSVQTNRSVSAKEFDPRTNTSETLFTVPFREATIVWGTTADAVHYVTPKPASRLEGYAYAAENGTLRRIPVSGFGLTVHGTDSAVLFSRQESGEYRTFIHNRETGQTTPNGITLLPEKCDPLPNASSTLLCAQTLTTYDERFPDLWYQGAANLEDAIWEVDLTTFSSAPVVDASAESGRSLDIVSLTTNPSEQRVYFQNKLDETLWIYERTQ